MASIDLSALPICITGASSGIGRATAIACAEAGMPVVLGARRLTNLEEVAKEIRAGGGRAEVVAVDVTNAAKCEAMVARCVEVFGSVYSVFANAGYGLERAVHAMSDAEIRAMFETNFYGTLNTIRPALPFMERAGRGHVLVCSSCVARFPLPYFSVYSASKSAQHHISRAMNLELRSKGIRVSSVHPVGTKTEFFSTASGLSGPKGHTMVEHTPEFFMQTPERVARAVVRCLRRPRPEVWTSLGTRLGMAIGGVIPRIADRALMRMVRDRERMQGAAEATERGSDGATKGD